MWHGMARLGKALARFEALGGTVSRPSLHQIQGDKDASTNQDVPRTSGAVEGFSMSVPTIDEPWLQRIVRSHPVYRSDEDGDLLQLGRLVVWRASSCYKGLSPALARTFIDKALRQRAGRLARKATNSPLTVSLDALLAPDGEDAPRWEPVDTAGGAENHAIRRALREWFDERISDLPAGDREALRLRYGWSDGQERSLREVAAALGTTLPWVQRALARAHRALRIECERAGWQPEELLEDLGRTT